MVLKPSLTLPALFVDRMKLELGNEYDRFAEALSEDPPVSVRIHPLKWKGRVPGEKVPWCGDGYYLSQRPLFTVDPWFHAGAYYVQEAASMFLEQALRAICLPSPALILDMCAAPGGKTTHLLSFINRDDLLVSNEVIRGRTAVLQENVQKWGYPNVVITSNDPRDFGTLGAVFDLVVVDAPCSGEGLFRKDEKSAGEWSVKNAEICAARQKRILAEAWKSLKPGGALIYSTCTYNPAENEENIRWLLSHPGSESLQLPVSPAWKIETIHDKDLTGYRFYPHTTRGEGFFMAVVGKQGKTDSGKTGKSALKQWRSVPRTTTGILKNWIYPGYEGVFLERAEEVSLFSSRNTEILPVLINSLNIIQLGIPVASVKNNSFNPHPAFALSLIFNTEAFPGRPLSKEQAISFLQKKEIASDTEKKGWTYVMYRDLPLGWMKNLGFRSNNYHPKNRRIRMETRETPRLWHEQEEL